MLFDRGQRFADSGPEFAGDLAQRIQDVFFSCGLHLLLVQHVSGAAVPGAQPQYVLAAEAVRSSLPGRRRWRFARRFPGRAPESAAHPPAGPSGRSAFWMRSSEMRLRKGDCSSCTAKPLAKRPVKHGVAGRVREIGEDDRVLVREFGRAVKIEVAGDEERQQQPRRREQSPSSVLRCRTWLRARTPVSRPESVSRFRRWRSVRISEACW